MADIEIRFDDSKCIILPIGIETGAGDSLNQKIVFQSEAKSQTGKIRTHRGKKHTWSTINRVRHDSTVRP